MKTSNFYYLYTQRVVRYKKILHSRLLRVNKYAYISKSDSHADIAIKAFRALPPLVRGYINALDKLYVDAASVFPAAEALMRALEGSKSRVYDDVTGRTPKDGKFFGHPTIGIGCNLHIYRNALRDVLFLAPHAIEQLMLGARILSPGEISKLFFYCFNDHMQALKNIYGSCLHKLPAKLVLVLFSLHFNAGRRLVGRGTIIHSIVQLLCKHLSALQFSCANTTMQNLVNELCRQASKQQLRGLKHRRYVEAGIILSGILEIKRFK